MLVASQMLADALALLLTLEQLLPQQLLQLLLLAQQMEAGLQESLILL